MTARVYPERACAKCEASFTPTGPAARFCAACKTKPASNGRPNDLVLTPEQEPAPAALTPMDVADAFDLDFNLGNAVLFILDRENGDVRANLMAAQNYITRALARLR